MSFRYINPGYAEPLSKKGDLTTVENFAYNPANKVSISGNNNTYDNWPYIKLPYVPNEIYGLFNIVITAPSHHSCGQADLLFHADYGVSYSCVGFSLRNSGPNVTSLRCCFNIDSYYYTTETDLVFSNYYDGSVKKIWFHIKPKISKSDDNGLVECSIDEGKNIFSQEISTTFQFVDQRLYVHLYENHYISNLILSDEYINPKEKVISLPISSNETDMTFDSDTGIYTATAANQILMSAINADYLANEYGSDSAVTGIALIGNPAYKTANGLTSLTAQSKENNVISDIETISLDDDTSAMILASQKIANKTIADLQNVQFGWKAGT